MWVYFMAIVLFCGHKFCGHLLSFPPFLVRCTKKTLATLLLTRWKLNNISCHVQNFYKPNPIFPDQLPNGGRLAHEEGGAADGGEPVGADPDAEEAPAAFAGLRPGVHSIKFTFQPIRFLIIFSVV
jgi:hypothetical protein